MPLWTFNCESLVVTYGAFATSPGFGEMPHWSGLMVHGKFLADLLPKVQPGNGALQESLILRVEATPEQSFSELNVKAEGVPLGVVYGTFNGVVSISQMLPTNTS